MSNVKKVPGAGYPPPAPPKDAPSYEALGPVFVNGRLHEKGEQFRSAEKPGRFWKLIEAPKPAAAGGKAKQVKEKTAPAQDSESAQEAGGDDGRAADQSPI